MAFRKPIKGMLAALVGLLLCALLASCSEQPRQIGLGSEFPALTLTETSGKSVTLAEAASGKLTALLLWREGCTFCEREMPLMQPLYTKHSRNGFTIIAVHLGGTTRPSSEIALRHGLTFPMLTDTSETLRQTYGIKYVPMIFVLDSSGRVVEKILGGVSADALERIILERLK